MPQFERPGASIHYQLLGEGPPLLLIAGTASDGASWGPLLPLLGGRRLILVDNRGSGQTTSEGLIRIEDMADDCAALLGQLGLEAVDVVGHSLGGFLALMLAAAEPQRVRRVVTLTSGVIPQSRRVLFRDLSRLYFTTPPQDWFRLLFQWLFSDPFFAEETNVAAAAAASTAYRFRQSPEDFARQVSALDSVGPVDLSRVASPVLAVGAEHDLLAPGWAVEALHRTVPDVTHRRIEGAAHSVHWEKPEAVAEAILGFLG